jgi:nicotinamidase-related amidase
MSPKALLICDIQKGILSHITTAYSEEVTKFYVSLLASTIKSAHDASVPVIYVKTAFRTGYPETGNRNPTFSRVRGTGLFLEGHESAEIDPSVIINDGNREEDIVVVTKRRVSALYGTDLDVLLKGMGIKEIVMAGLSTSGVILSTLRQASDLDYDIVVLKNGCMDTNEEVHRVLMDLVFPKQGRVLLAEDWVKEISDGGEEQ